MTPLDLSGCTKLETLQLAIMLPRPGRVADAILPSLASFSLSKIVLKVEPWSDEIDFQAWEVMEGYLCRLAKQFNASHPGGKMEVKISPGRPNFFLQSRLLEWLGTRGAMSKLKEEADVVIIGE